MKTKIFIFLLVTIVFSSLAGKAQIQVVSNGKVKVFGNIENNDPYNELSMEIYGPYGSALSNGRIGIGDYGRVDHNGVNVFIGELGTNWDSDRLQLHGKKGVYLTYGLGYDNGDIIGKFDITEPDRFKFEVDVYAKGILLSSDSRFKENIKPLGKKLSILKKLNGMSYNLKSSKKNSVDINSLDNLTEKERNDLDMLNNINNEDHVRFGFIAQDVKTLFPELVQEDADGYLYIDYVGMIPVLVESVKEQQEQINELLQLAKKKGLLTNEN